MKSGWGFSDYVEAFSDNLCWMTPIIALVIFFVGLVLV